MENKCTLGGVGEGYNGLSNNRKEAPASAIASPSEASRTLHIKQALHLVVGSYRLRLMGTCDALPIRSHPAVTNVVNYAIMPHRELLLAFVSNHH
ncbi:hypothetical protein J6590_038877 [Homalodisca vitripennis]|nr:hypothetical protein J6590_013787 [Homalodisca vitripennis]KAG8297273.1 hypothetical protein J6590_038877 [Homalodisca vitripennis]